MSAEEMPHGDIMERMFLATTSIDEFWDDSLKIAFLGPWCVPYGKEHILQDLRNGYEYLPLLWGDTKEIEAAVKYCFEVFVEFLDEITIILNEIHGLDKSRRYYHCILGHWLYMFIHQSYDKYLSLKAAIERNPDIKTYALDHEQFIVPTDVGDTLSKINYDCEYNLQMYSQIVKHLPIEVEIRRLKSPLKQSSSFITKNKMENRAKSRGEIFFDLMNSLFRSRSVMLSGTHFKQRDDFYKLAVGSRFLFTSDDMKYRTETEFQIDLNLRKNVKMKSGKDEFGKILSEIIFLNIPALYLEAFSDFRAKTLALPIRKADAYYTTTGMYSNSIFQFAVAEKIGKALIVMHQHGGNYNTAAVAEEEHIERMCSDVLFTWGWSDSPNTIPLPHPMLVRPSGAGSISSSGKPLLVMTSHPLNVFRIQIPVISSRYGEYLNDVMNFMSSYNGDILVRTSPSDFQQHTQERMLSRMKDIRFDDFSKSFVERMLEASVVVQGHLATTYLECIAMNIPVILFLPPSRYRFIPSSRDLFDQMKSVKILHDDPESAAKHLEEIHGNIGDWWNSASVREFLKVFKKEHARSDPDWVKAWTREFTRILSKEFRETCANKN